MAETCRLAAMVNWQVGAVDVVDVAPAQVSPVQLTNLLPRAGVAVTLTTVFLSRTVAQLPDATR